MRCWEGRCRCGCGEVDVAGGVRGLAGLETELVRLLAAMLHSWRARASSCFRNCHTLRHYLTTMRKKLCE
jgi:hypothetical protein